MSVASTSCLQFSSLQNIPLLVLTFFLPSLTWSLVRVGADVNVPCIAEYSELLFLSTHFNKKFLWFDFSDKHYHLRLYFFINVKFHNYSFQWSNLFPKNPVISKLQNYMLFFIPLAICLLFFHFRTFVSIHPGVLRGCGSRRARVPQIYSLDKNL